MLNTADLIADPRFPTWISNHSIFKSTKSIKKIFPEIGLNNCSEMAELDNSKEVVGTATALLRAIEAQIADRLSTLTHYSESKSFGKVRVVKYKTVAHLLNRVKIAVGKTKNCIIKTDQKITLNLSADVADQDGKVIFKAGEGVFRVYQKLNEMLRLGHFLAMPALESMLAFKNFSAVNIPPSHIKLIFSSDGIEGAWDIATMSMRGINSCQTWGQGNSTHIVGSIVDPFTGIIYITSGSRSKYGSKMMRRCVVRFVVSQAGNIPHLMLERMYPDHDASVMDLFVKFLSKKTNGEIKILIGKHGSSPAGMYVPMVPVVGKLDPKDQPYRDSAISYQQDQSNPQTQLNKAKLALSSLSYNLGYRVGPLAVKRKVTEVPKDSKVNYGLFKMGRLYRARDARPAEVAKRFSLDGFCATLFNNLFQQNHLYEERANPWETAVLRLELFRDKEFPSIINNEIKTKLEALGIKDEGLLFNIMADIKEGLNKYIQVELLKFQARATKEKDKYLQVPANQNFQSLLKKVS
jgi:hypothetical protein